MADRRMLTKKVTDDDNFMALSSSAQALYLHLLMSCDDDGFSNQVSISMFKAHASVQDLEALLNKRYIYQFDNGVIVIKHWRMANALRKDRYTPTAFQEELAMLNLKGNGAYTMKNEWLPNGCQMVATDKDRLDKDKLLDISKDISMSTEVDSGPSCQQVVDLFHSICISYPKIRKISNSRNKAIKARLREYSFDDLKLAFEKAEASSFMKGNNSRNWSANFDWIMDGNHLPKILEGNYDNKSSAPANSVAPQNKNNFNNFNQRNYDFDDLERKLLGGNN